MTRTSGGRTHLGVEADERAPEETRRGELHPGVAVRERGRREERRRGLKAPARGERLGKRRELPAAGAAGHQGDAPRERGRACKGLEHWFKRPYMQPSQHVLGT